VATPTLQVVPDELNNLSRVVLDSAFKVHKALGPGLLESSYRVCLAHELKRNGLKIETEIAVPIRYEGILLGTGYRLDLLVNKVLVVELKAVDSLLAIHQAQLLSYLKHSDKRLGLLINFNSVLLKNGIRRVINSK
jgi:GxxExxY protein